MKQAFRLNTFLSLGAYGLCLRKESLSVIPNTGQFPREASSVPYPPRVLIRSTSCTPRTLAGHGLSTMSKKLLVRPGREDISSMLKIKGYRMQKKECRLLRPPGDTSERRACLSYGFQVHVGFR